MEICVVTVVIYRRPSRSFPGGLMLVQRVLMPDSLLESWTVLGDGGGTVEPIERYLAYLTDIERSPNTVKAYAHDLKDWFVFLGRRGLDWREVRLEDLGEFVAWLRLPPAGRDGRVALLPSAEHHCGVTTVNRKLSAVSGLYVFHARHGVDLGDLVTELQPVRSRRKGWKPFLYHLAGGQPERRRTIKLKSPRSHPTILTAVQVQAILDACTRLRDRFLFALLWETGIRIGEALGLRHEDLAAAEGELAVIPRVNDNRARAKSASPRTVPVGPEIVRLYADYLHAEYGDLDSDYMFVNLWGGAYGHPLTYAAVYDLVLRIRRDTGVDFDPHWFRHTRATLLLRRGVPIEVVSTLLGHSSIATTLDTYGHLSVEDARRALEAAGFLTGREVSW
ncbi:tyrosine-type recombinase/integrase [Kitasatospora sp. NPDC096128]|uniref:tyrosine-type recombinase/integrase n=1 Tax=Kitasatospora sp. NPDC096128 TaxID=3155547 RepID=UPI00332E7C62